jgi:hypothetical protein
LNPKEENNLIKNLDFPGFELIMKKKLAEKKEFIAAVSI